MSIIVQLHSREGAGVKGDRVDLIVGACDGKDGGDCIIRGVSFDCDRSIWDPVHKHGAEVNTFLRRRKDFRQSSEKLQGTPLQVRCMRGTTIFK